MLRCRFLPLVFSSSFLFFPSSLFPSLAFSSSFLSFRLLVMKTEARTHARSHHLAAERARSQGAPGVRQVISSVVRGVREHTQQRRFHFGFFACHLAALPHHHPPLSPSSSHVIPNLRPHTLTPVSPFSFFYASLSLSLLLATHVHNMDPWNVFVWLSLSRNIPPSSCRASCSVRASLLFLFFHFFSSLLAPPKEEDGEERSGRGTA